ncbi:MAG TPA: GNAT family N-acetyltransferase [Bryobacteraceae bacterium]
MRHNLTIDGPDYRLRPVCREDARFISELRSDPERNRYMHKTPPGAAAQEQWLEAYFDREGDYYFLIENRATGLPEGTAGIYNVGWRVQQGTDRLLRDAEWGRWILRRGSLGALESACLVYRAGFDSLDLDSMFCRTIVENSAALAFHDLFGMDRGRLFAGYLELEGRSLSAIERRLTRARWKELRGALEGRAFRAPRWSQPPLGTVASGSVKEKYDRPQR